MDEITPQRIGEFLRTVFMRLWQEPDGLPIEELLASIPQSTQLNADETALLPDGHTAHYEKQLRLAAGPFIRAGWMVKNKGRWLLTPEGRHACKRFAKADDFYLETGRILHDWQQSHAELALVTDEAEEKAWAQVHTYLQELDAFGFQQLVEDLLRAMGYHLDWIAPPEKERGFVNFIIYSDPLGISIPRIKVHIQHSGQPVLLEGLKAFVSTLSNEDAGIFISSGGFTRAVLDEARELKSVRLTLLDLEAFFDLWLKYYDRLTPEARQRFPLSPVHFLALAE